MYCSSKILAQPVMKLLLLLVCALAVSATADNDTVIVGTENGLVRGILQYSILNQVPFYSFRGIPYAAPPTGQFRFREPQPVHNWNNVKDALNYGNACPQTDIRQLIFDRDLPDNLQGDEDCLFINVFTPSVPAVGENGPLKAVLVYVHGGGFFTGSSDDFSYGPDHLAEEDVVYVSFNYRLGALGFLSLDNTDAPGNYGMKDMVQALKWVKKNIAAFGGDPDNVTLFGQSAGAGAVSLLMVSPLSQRLFHRVICQSGSLANGWAITEQNPRPNAFKLGEHLGLYTNNDTKLLEFLRTQDPLQLAKLSSLAATASYDQIPNYIKAIQFAFAPTIEPKEVGAKAFLTKEPLKILKNGEFTKVPLMIGHTTQENIFLYKKSELEGEVLKSIITNLRINLPIRNIRVLDTSLAYENVLNTLKYVHSLNQFTDATAENYLQLDSTIWFTLPIEIATKIQLKVSTEKTYFYRFNFNGGLNVIKQTKGLSTVLPGASHADEFCYQFYCREYKEKYEALDKNSSDYNMIKKWSRLFTNFAKTGDPTPVLDPVLDNVQWKPRTKQDANYLEIDDTVKMNKIPKINIYTVWNILLKYLKISTWDMEDLDVLDE